MLVSWALCPEVEVRHGMFAQSLRASINQRWPGRILKHTAFLCPVHSEQTQQVNLLPEPRSTPTPPSFGLLLEQSAGMERGERGGRPGYRESGNVHTMPQTQEDRKRGQVFSQFVSPPPQLPERRPPDTFKCFWFLSEVYSFHFFLLYKVKKKKKQPKKQPKKKKNYEVAVKESMFWCSRVGIGFREFYVLIL